MKIHVDMDAFYASVEVRDNPALAGRPVVVGGSARARGVVAAASYAARKYGIHSAMPMIRAQRLCPELVVLPVRMDRYIAVSREIHDIFSRYTPFVESLALDEAFLEASGSERLFGSSEEIARNIKNAIRDELGLVASVGVAPTKFLAKIASDINKPDGFVVIEPRQVRAFLDPLPVSRIWGAGKVTQAGLEKLGIRTIGQLRRQPPELLRDRFGKQGQHMWELAHNKDPREVVPDRKVKSISNETTFAEDIGDLALLESWLAQLAEQVAWRLRRGGLFANVIQLKLRFADFSTVTRSCTLAGPEQSTRVILESAKKLLLERIPRNRFPVRLIGVGVHSLTTEAGKQASLFSDDHQRVVDKVTDTVNTRFGPRTLRRGRSIFSKSDLK